MILRLDKEADIIIFKLAWPSIIEMILEMMVGVVSTIFMGHVGTEALAAVGLINFLIGFLQTSFSGLSTGATVIVARVIGEGNPKEAKNVLIQSIYLSIVIGLLLTLVCKIFTIPIINLFFRNATELVYNYATDYFSVILIGLVFFVLNIVISGTLRGSGDTKVPMLIAGITNVINIILNFILVFGSPFLHIPALGVFGSALAVTISRCVGLLLRIYVLFFINGIKLRLDLKDDFCFRPLVMKRIINIGIPSFLEQAVMQGGFLILQVIISSIGTAALAAYQVGININALAFFPLFGFGIANTALVGQSLGEKNLKKSEKYAYESLKLSIIIGAILGFLMVVFSKPLASLYSNDPLVIKEALILVIAFGILEPLIGILNSCSSTLRAAGDIKYVMCTSFVGLWVCRVAISYILNEFFDLGILAVAIAIFFDFSSRSIMYLLRMNKKKWLYLKV